MASGPGRIVRLSTLVKRPFVCQLFRLPGLENHFHSLFEPRPAFVPLNSPAVKFEAEEAAASAELESSAG
jgi:hypothetical protein